MNNSLELIFILDRSGSMYHLTADTIGGFNSLLDKHREEYKGILLTTVLFNNTLTTIHDRIPSSQAAYLTEQDYVPNGSTALYDAVGTTIKHIEVIHKYIRSEDVPKKTMFFIITDGLENASTQYSLDQIQKIIEEKRTQFGWEFVFMGADIEAKEVAREMKMDANRAHRYEASKRGFIQMFLECDEELPF